MGSKKKITLDDIFNDDEFGILEIERKSSNVKTEEQRLLDAFEEINVFVDKNNRHPSQSSMSEYGLLATLKNFKENEEQKEILKPYDRHNLLGDIQVETHSIDDILNQEDELGLLDVDKDLDIFKIKHIPKEQDKNIQRAQTEFVAQRISMQEDEFKPYETMFQQVHKDLSQGKRKLLPFSDVEKHLCAKQFYLLDGMLLYLDHINFDRSGENLSGNTARRRDGRTLTVFENATKSNILYRSLSKNLYSKNGKMVSTVYEGAQDELFVAANAIKDKDIQTGWVYVLKSHSSHPEIMQIPNLYKIGVSASAVEDRVKNAKNEATYLYADVNIVATYQCYNRRADKLEQLLHRFFAQACLNIDVELTNGQRITPREWFVVPFDEIDKAITLILNEQILQYKYDIESQKIVFNNV